MAAGGGGELGASWVVFILFYSIATLYMVVVVVVKAGDYSRYGCRVEKPKVY